MRPGNTKLDLQEATMQIIAEKGLSFFSMKQVTQRIGVSEALIYRYFESKDVLLYSCFESLHKKIAELFDNVTISDLQSQTPSEFIHSLWLKYFKFLISNTYRTIFYFDYRDSQYIRIIQEHDDEAVSTYFSAFVKLVNMLDSQFHFFDKVKPEYIWLYILDTTGLFARRIINGDLPNTEESYENIWRLVSNGIFGLAQIA